MSRNLTSQLKYVVNTSFYGDELTGRTGGFKSSKHSDKRNNTKMEKYTPTIRKIMLKV